MSKTKDSSPHASSGRPRLSRDLFREGMSRVASAVHVVATDGISGRAGFTATAVTAVADDPATLLVCANASGHAVQALLDNGAFSVNTLATQDEPLARAFGGAAEAKERFDFGTWDTWPSGIPRAASALAAFECEVLEARLFSSHYIIIGEVRDIVLPSVLEEGDASSLLYWRRRYRDLLP